MSDTRKFLDFEQSGSPTQKQTSHAHFGLWVGYFFSLNIVVGSGFLSLPFSFNNSGWLLGLLFMVITALQTYYIARQLIEVMSKMEYITQLEEKGVDVVYPSLKDAYKGVVTPLPERDGIVPTITDRRFDVTTIVRIAFGKNYSFVYMGMLYLLVTTILVAFISIFSTSFSAIIPLGFAGTCNIYNDKQFFGSCRVNYWFYLSIYCVCMVYVTVKGLREQMWMQSVLTMMRFAIMAIILITCLALIGSESNIKNDHHVPFRMEDPVKLSDLLGSLSNIIFAFSYQLQFPTIAEYIKDRKRNLNKVALLVSTTTFIVYALVAIIVPIAIHNVKPQCNLEYADYSAGYSQSNKPWWTYIIAYAVILFPALDVFSSFPLLAVPLADNLITLVSGNAHEVTNDKIRQRNYRFIAVIPPFVISIFWFNIGEIMAWVGIFVFILIPLSLPFLHTITREMVHVESDFDAPFYSKWFNLAICIFNFFLMIAVIYGNIFTFS